jgi:apolipoprotein D and lipocalin family protein
MKKIFILVIFAFLSFSVISTCERNDAKLPKPVENFEINKYLGLWYEIGRFQNSFQTDCISSTAHYSARDDGGINVLNTCFDKDGKERTAEAVGYFKRKNRTDLGLLQVSFFRPIYGDYRIIMLDKDYQYAVVVSDIKYLWILSRTPTLDQNTLDKIKHLIGDTYFDWDNIIFDDNSRFLDDKK